MIFGEKANLPHIVYRIYDAQGVLLWVGMTKTTFGRIGSHLSGQPWKDDIDTVKVTRFENWAKAAYAEQEAINNEKPKYNKLIIPPENVGKTDRNQPSIVLGYTCPRCNGLKEPDKTYCLECTRTYNRERKIALGWTPRPPPSTICPKCGGPKLEGPSYCKKCKTKWQRENRRKKLTKPAQDNT